MEPDAERPKEAALWPRLLIPIVEREFDVGRAIAARWHRAPETQVSGPGPSQGDCQPDLKPPSLLAHGRPRAVC